MIWTDWFYVAKPPLDARRASFSQARQLKDALFRDWMKSRDPKDQKRYEAAKRAAQKAFRSLCN